MQKSIESILADIKLIQTQSRTTTDDSFALTFHAPVQKQKDPMVVSIINILKQYPVKRAALFGSAARQEMTQASDVDIIVELQPGTPGLDFYGLGGDLEDTLGCHVDLLSWGSLNNAKYDFIENVKKDARLIYESKN